MMVCKGIKCI